MSLLSIIRNAALIVGVDEPSFVKGNDEFTPKVMLALANRGGSNLVRMRNGWGGGWAVLTRMAVIETDAGRTEYDWPADYAALIDGTVWDRASHQEVRGPLSPQEWQQAKYGGLGSAAPRYRIAAAASGNRTVLVLAPAPAAAETLVYEYISRNWVAAGEGEALTRRQFEEDTDIAAFDRDLMEMDLVWRFKQARGLSFAADLAEFEIERDRRFATDAGMRTLGIAGPRRPVSRGRAGASGVVG